MRISHKAKDDSGIQSRILSSSNFTRRIIMYGREIGMVKGMSESDEYISATGMRSKELRTDLNQ